MSINKGITPDNQRRNQLALFEDKVIDEAKADAYVYGYELLISSIVSILLVILIAAVCGDVRYSLSFLIGFIPQRIYIGGYHATSHTKCYLAFSGLELICILLSKTIVANHLFRILTTAALLGISIILSPIEAKNMIDITHCYHDILYSYDSGGHLMDTTKSYHQAVGG